jgi:hypothetical protein
MVSERERSCSDRFWTAATELDADLEDTATSSAIDQVIIALSATDAWEELLLPRAEGPPVRAYTREENRVTTPWGELIFGGPAIPCYCSDPSVILSPLWYCRELTCEVCFDSQASKTLE